MPNQISLGVWVVLALMMSTCKSTSGSISPSDAQLATTDTAQQRQPKLCAAIRGNGNLIMSHFGALARITEEFGLIEGGAGGSSASISLFIYESIYSNKLVNECDNPQTCTDQERAARAAFLLKSTLGYVQVLGNTAEAASLKFLVPFAKALYEKDTDRLLKTDPEAARASINALLTAQDLFAHEDLKALVNQNFLTFLNGKADINFRANEGYQAIADFGDFKATDKRIFLRPGVLDFQMVAKLIGHIGDFYAGLVDEETSEGMRALLNSCAQSTKGKDWLTIAQSACGGQFHDLVVKFRDRRRDDGNPPSTRPTQPIGKYLPMLPITSVIKGQTAIDSIDAAKQTYINNATPTLPASVTLKVDFTKDVQFGYWGPRLDLARAQKFLSTQKDLKSQKFMALGESTWQEALELSPAEPGLASILPLRDMRSAAGWADLHPVQVLKGIGCEKVIYVTRQGEESKFATGVATQLGMKPAQKSALYELKKGSAYQNAVDMADAIWCTDWDQFSGSAAGDVAAHMLHAYKALLVSKDPRFARSKTGYLNSVESSRLPGCRQL